MPQPNTSTGRRAALGLLLALLLLGLFSAWDRRLVPRPFRGRQPGASLRRVLPAEREGQGEPGTTWTECA